MTYVAPALALFILGALAWSHLWLAGALRVSRAELARLDQVLEGLETGIVLASDLDGVRAHLEDHLNRLAALERGHEDLLIAVAEGIKHVERAENRVRATIRRAREELEENGLESPALNAEARELSLFDGPGGGADGMPPMPEHVAPAPSSVPGVTQEQLARARGF